MKLNNKKFIAPLAALLLAMAPAFAQAGRVYFLVGVRHMYQIGPDKYAYVQQRENIEEGYADGVAADQATYQQHVNSGADPYQESAALNADLDRLAVQRDEQLAQIYHGRDDILARHPSLRLAGDGPYQVIGIDYNPGGPFLNYVVYAPWPGYAWSGGYYGGWHYGVVYSPSLFINLYSGWHSHWGGGRFYGGFYGHFGWVSFHPTGYVYRASGYHGNGGGYSGVNIYHTQIVNHFSRTVINNYRSTVVNNSRAHSTGAHSGGAAGSFRSAPRSGYSAPRASHGSFGMARPNAAPRAGGSFGHAPAPRAGGSFGHTPAPRATGSFGHAPAPRYGGSSSFGHAAPHSTGSFGRTAPHSGAAGHNVGHGGGSFGHKRGH
jgi:hypothetical protein